MSRVFDQLQKTQPSDHDSIRNASEDMQLDPFIHKPQPRIWKRIRTYLSFDRVVITGFIMIAAVVLTYRAVIYRHEAAPQDVTPISQPGLQKAMPSAETVVMSSEQKTAPDQASPQPENFPEGDAAVKTAGVPVKAAAAGKAAEPNASKQQAPKAEAFKPHFTLQLATYDKKARAENELAWLKQRGLDGTVVTGNKKYLLTVGKFEDKKSAERKLKTVFSGDFKKRYPDTYVRYVKD